MSAKGVVSRGKIADAVDIIRPSILERASQPKDNRYSKEICDVFGESRRNIIV